MRWLCQKRVEFYTQIYLYPPFTLLSFMNIWVYQPNVLNQTNNNINNINIHHIGILNEKWRLYPERFKRLFPSTLNLNLYLFIAMSVSGSSNVLQVPPEEVFVLQQHRLISTTKLVHVSNLMKWWNTAGEIRRWWQQFWVQTDNLNIEMMQKKRSSWSKLSSYFFFYFCSRFQNINLMLRIQHSTISTRDKKVLTL